MAEMEQSEENLEEMLLAVYRTGDEQRYFILLYEHFSPLLRRFLLGRVGPGYRECIDDILQKGFLDFMVHIKNLGQYDFPRNHSAFLTRTMWNEYLNEYKRRKRGETVSIELEHDGEQATSPIEAQLVAENYSEDWLGLKLFLEEVSDSIEQLDEPLKRVMRMIRDEDLDEEAIAHRLKRPQKTIKDWIHRGREQLRKMYPDRSEYLQMKNRKAEKK